MGIRFTAPSDHLPLSEYAANLSTDAYQAQAQWLLLKELLDNGQAETSGMGIHLSSDEVCRLDSVEQELLGLPEPYPFDLEIRSFGTLNEPEFRYNYQFLKPDRKPLHPERIWLYIAFDRGVGVSSHTRTVCPSGRIGCVQQTGSRGQKFSIQSA